MTDVAFLVVFVVVALFGLQALWAHQRLSILIGHLESTTERVADLEAAADLQARLGGEHRCQHLAMTEHGVEPCEGTAVVLVELDSGSVHAYCSEHRPAADAGDWSTAA